VPSQLWFSRTLRAVWVIKRHRGRAGRFWTRGRDLLFAAFCAAFLLPALNQALVTLSGVPSEERSWLFLLRLAAFVFLALAVTWKTFEKRSEM